MVEKTTEQNVRDELVQIEEAIQAQESQRDKLPDNLIELTLQALYEKRDALKQKKISLAGGAAAIGNRNVVLGQGAVLVGRDIHGSVYIGQPAQNDKEALQIYLWVLANSQRLLPMRSLNPDACSAGDTGGQMTLESVYVALNTTAFAGDEPRSSTKRVEDSLVSSEKIRAISAMEAVARHRQVVITGDPGSGKTTFLRHLTLCLAAVQIDSQSHWNDRLADWPGNERNCLPIPVILRNFARSITQESETDQPNTLWRFIRSGLKKQNLLFAARPLRKALERGTALVLLDGLDEIPSAEQRIRVRDATNAFVHRYPKSRIIVSCRTHAYKDPAWRLDGMAHFTLAPFDDALITQFIDAWYGELQRSGEIKSVQEADELANRLKEAVQKEDIRRLAPNPMLLTVMAVVNTHKGRLPDARALLYADIVDLLLWRWDERKAAASKQAPRLREMLMKVGRSQTDLKQRLASLAHHVHDSAGSSGNDRLADIGEWQLIDHLRDLHPENSRDWAAEVVKTIKERAGLLIEREPGVYTFPHRTFQEYLAGAHLAANRNFSEVAANLWDDLTTWLEVILLAVGRLVYMVEDLDKPLALVQQLNLRPDGQHAGQRWIKSVMAGKCLLEIGLNRVQDRDWGKGLLKTTRSDLRGIIESGAMHLNERADAGATLGRLGDPRFNPGRWYLPDGDELGFVPIPAGEFIMGSDPADDSSAREEERYQHPITLPEYYMAKYPVTVDQYKAFIADSKAEAENVWHRFNKIGNHPAVVVSWYDAMGYCQWLTNVLRGSKHTPEPVTQLLKHKGWVVRLPSEAEWEKAARGDDGRIYPWTGEIDKYRANYRETQIDGTSPVGMFPQGESPYGLLDMSGNVWEWTHSLWGKNWEKPYYKYPYRPDDGREDELADRSILRVLRGGAFGVVAGFLRCAARFRYDPGDWDWYLGFRIVLAPGFH
jgi:formylglycine-generating enzyme required for sulfatase activity/energy-coupling factor transporter ATP-binding protein EcfA2